MRAFSYTCPECDEYSPRVEVVRTANGVTVECPHCGFVEEIKRNDQNRSRREVVAR